MSAEHFFASRRPNDNLVQEVRSFADTRTYGGGHSLVAVLAEKIADAGRDGLRAVAYNLERGSGVGVMSRSPEAATPLSYKPQDFTALVLGSSVVAIEQMLANKEYFHDRFIEHVNSRMVGTRLGKFAAPEPNNRWRSIQRGDWEQMVEAARRDPTLSIFLYKEYRSLLPETMKAFLGLSVLYTGKPFFDHIEEMLPWYSSLASAVVAQRKKQKVVVPEVFVSGPVTTKRRSYKVKEKWYSDFPHPQIGEKNEWVIF